MCMGVGLSTNVILNEEVVMHKVVESIGVVIVAADRLHARIKKHSRDRLLFLDFPPAMRTIAARIQELETRVIRQQLPTYSGCPF